MNTQTPEGRGSADSNYCRGCGEFECRCTSKPMTNGTIEALLTEKLLEQGRRSASGQVLILDAYHVKRIVREVLDTHLAALREPSEPQWEMPHPRQPLTLEPSSPLSGEVRALIATTKAEVLRILNRDLAPWTFDGTEPMCVELFAAIESALVDRSSTPNK